MSVQPCHTSRLTPLAPPSLSSRQSSTHHLNFSVERWLFLPLKEATMFSHFQTVGILIFVALSIACATNDIPGNKKGKIFPVFQVVSFANDICVSTSSSQNGTCYTAAECTSNGGVASGTCASSYGVCCFFSVKCGGTSSQNCTYFQSTGNEIGACRVNICPCSTNICQLRLDFNSFTITGPSTNTASVNALLNGVPTGKVSDGEVVSGVSQCQTDTFTVTNPYGGTPPVICGTNTGQHMYVDSSSSCDELAFQLGNAATGATLGARSWTIKITQYACDYPNLAPPGCTEYFWGSSVGSVQTYNYAGGQHLANQDQNFCIRKERGNCRICWTAVAATDFQVSGPGGSVMSIQQKRCCGYGNGGKDKLGGDCATIPGALRANNMKASRGLERLCGSGSGLGVLNTAAGAVIAMKSVCTDQVPFSIRFLSDNYEFGSNSGESSKNQNGFKLTYIQSATGC